MLVVCRTLVLESLMDVSMACWFNSTKVICLMSNDELKQKLLYMAYELESVKIQANEEIRKHKENTLHLFNVLQIACQERNVCRGRESELNSNVLSEIIVFAFR
ncbi:hypothetical protein Droror1_Dr00015849 [Drosera rotundifolia]